MRKKLSAVLAAAVLAAGILLPMPRAQAIDAWAIAAQALGVFGAYKSSLAAVLAMGTD
ncbi:MAG: hypothetical protein HXO75_05105, partial [Selenomonas artemidis]|nr:hypothetical protein [Selenomonas artemidis]